MATLVECSASRVKTLTMKIVSILLMCSFLSVTFSQEKTSNENDKVKQTKSKTSKKSIDKNKNMSKVVFIPAKKPVKK